MPSVASKAAEALGWQRLGRLLEPSEVGAKHTMLPTPVLLKSGVLRVFFGATDVETVSSVRYVDVDARHPTRVIGAASDAVLGRGRAGCFDDNGVAPSCLVRYNNYLFLFYIGYQKYLTVKFGIFSGLAISQDDGKTFHRTSEAPILDRVDGELSFRSTPFVWRAGARWTMVYGGGTWGVLDGAPVAESELRLLESSALDQWQRGKPRTIDSYRRPGEYCSIRPWIAPDDRTEVVFSVRSLSGYRLASGHRRQRRMTVLGTEPFRVPADEWESGTACYASMVRWRDRIYMFYCGGLFGGNGIGVAVRRARDSA